MADSDAGGLIELRRAFLRGLVIPAHPLALTADRRLDERRQVALTRYYCDAGTGGIAVAVHTTQFEIRQPEVGLFRPVLELAFRTMQEWCRSRQPPPISVAGVVGRTAQALAEAELAASLGYDAALLSLAAMRYVSKRLGRRVGGSTGTNFIGVLEIARRMQASHQRGSIVTILCDSGERYSHSYYNPEWYEKCGVDVTAADATLEAALAGATIGSTQFASR